MAAFNREIFARLWNDHSIPTARIAAAMGITRAGVSWHARRMGLPSRVKLRRRLHDPALLAEMWLAGVRTTEIAAHFGMAHRSCVSNAARTAGLPLRSRGPAGARNGGWPRNLPIAEFWALRAADRMAAAAAAEQRAADRVWSVAA